MRRRFTSKGKPGSRANENSYRISNGYCIHFWSLARKESVPQVSFDWSAGKRGNSFTSIGSFLDSPFSNGNRFESLNSVGWRTGEKNN